MKAMGLRAEDDQFHFVVVDGNSSHDAHLVAEDNVRAPKSFNEAQALSFFRPGKQDLPVPLLRLAHWQRRANAGRVTETTQEHIDRENEAWIQHRRLWGASEE